MERFLQATRDYPQEQQFPPFYEGIVGARRCSAGDAPCDLSRGIETDVPSRTITIHLTRPDGDFLHRLTMPFAFVVPADSPRRATSGRTPPGPAPIASPRGTGSAAERSSATATSARHRLARAAPASRTASTSARHADEHDRAADRRGPARYGRCRRPRQPVQHPRVAGAAASAAGPLPGPDAQRPVAGHRLDVPQRAAAPVRRHRGVRRAINFAIDREKVVELEGGPEVAQPTCQIVPPGFPGHQPVLPVHRYRPPAASGGPRPTWSRRAGWWRRPGGPARAWSSRCRPIRPRSAGYYAALLNDLGFRATLRVLAPSSYVRLHSSTHAPDRDSRNGARTTSRPRPSSNPNFKCAARKRPEQPEPLPVLQRLARAPVRSRTRDAAGGRPGPSGPRSTNASRTSPQRSR